MPSIDFEVPSGPVAGEPDEGDEVSIEEAIVFAADLAGHLEYVLDKPAVGFAA